MDAQLAVATACENELRISEAEVLFRLAGGSGSSESELALAEFLLRHGRSKEAETNLRRVLVRGSYLFGVEQTAAELLERLLSERGRADEFERIHRFGLEPDGSTAIAW